MSASYSSANKVDVATTAWVVDVCASDDDDTQTLIMTVSDAVVAPTISGWTLRENFSSTLGPGAQLTYTRKTATGVAAGTLPITMPLAVRGGCGCASAPGDYESSATTEGTWTTSPVSPSVVVVNDASTAITAVGSVKFPRVYDAPAGVVEIENASPTPPTTSDQGQSSQSGPGIGIGHKTVNAGSTGLFTWTSRDYYANPPDNSERYIGTTVIIAPSAGGGGGGGSPVELTGEWQDSFTASSRSIDRPAGLTGEAVVIGFAYKLKSAVLTPPAGWVVRVDLPSPYVEGAGKLVAFEHVYPSDQASPVPETWTWSAAVEVAAGGGKLNGEYLDKVQQAYSNAASWPTPSVASAAAGSMVLAWVGSASWPRGIVAPGAWAQKAAASAGNGPSIAMATHPANVETLPGPTWTPSIEEIYQAANLLYGPLASVTGNRLSGAGELFWFERPSNLAVSSNSFGSVLFSWEYDGDADFFRFYSDNGVAGRLALPRDDVPITDRSAQRFFEAGTYDVDVVAVKTVEGELVESAPAAAVSFVAAAENPPPRPTASVTSDGPKVVELSDGVTALTFTALYEDNTPAAGKPVDSAPAVTGSAITLLTPGDSTTNGSGAIAATFTVVKVGTVQVSVIIDSISYSTSVEVVDTVAVVSQQRSAWARGLIRHA